MREQMEFQQESGLPSSVDQTPAETLCVRRASGPESSVLQ